jgi:hypothetical protein
MTHWNIWHLKISFKNLFEKLFFIVCSEWLLAKHDCVKKDSSGPYIRSLSTVMFFLTNLRWHESWSAAEYLHLLSWLGCKSKVYNFGVALIWTHIYQNIIWLDISVCNILRMIEIHSWNNLVEYLDTLSLRQQFPRPIFQYVVEHLSFHIF